MTSPSSSTQGRLRQGYKSLLGDVSVEHRDGVPWHSAPLPRRWHRCRVQTRGWIDLNCWERCACGAIRRSGDRPWVERNTRRRAS